MTLQDIQTLCSEDESDWLDYKREQYHFTKENGNDNIGEKAAFIKDVLSFANTRREKDALILIGVVNPTKTKKNIRGIPKNQLIDDATLQQMVSSKTNQNVPLSSQSISINKSATRFVQVIAIPPCFEKVPFYLKKDFGNIKREEVWYRLGSSNTKAKPEDLVLFGRQIEQDKTCTHVMARLESPNQVDRENTLVTFHLIPKESNPGKKAFDFAFIHKKEIALSLVKIHLFLRNDSAKLPTKVKVRLSLERTEPRTAKCVDTNTLFGQDPYSSSFLDSDEVEETIELRPGETRSEVCPLVFDTNGDGSAVIHVSVVADGQGIIMDKDVRYQIQQFDYHHDFSKLLPSYLLWRNEKETFDWIHNRAKQELLRRRS